MVGLEANEGRPGSQSQGQLGIPFALATRDQHAHNHHTPILHDFSHTIPVSRQREYPSVSVGLADFNLDWMTLLEHGGLGPASRPSLLHTPSPSSRLRSTRLPPQSKSARYLNVLDLVMKTAQSFPEPSIRQGMCLSVALPS